MGFSQKITLLVGLLAATFLGGYWLGQPGIATAVTTPQQQQKKPLYYQCPMHPAYRSDRPGAAPCCGMELAPVYAGDAPASAGAVNISLEKQQLMGLRTARVARGSGVHTIRVLGRVAVDETRVHKVTSQVEGVVREVSGYAPGDVVRKDDLLATYFVTTPELYSAIQSYFVAMNARDQGIALNPQAVLDASKAQLRLSEELLQSYGLTIQQINELARTRQITRDIQVRSPATGLVLARNASLGQRLEKGGEVFRVADLTHVWAVADVFESDSGMLTPGAPARVRYQGRTYPARICDSRQFDPVSRTLKVRLELDNPKLTLRPEMFVDVEVDVREPEGLSVPADALVDSGRRRVVFVSTGEGSFAAREVVVGARYGDRVEILEGVGDGDDVVVSGLFLLDSESRLQLAASHAHSHAAPSKAAAAAGQVDPICGMEVEAAKNTPQSVFQGTTYYFCSGSCKEEFDKNPAKYAGKKEVTVARGESL
jgi:Cu(I)/Ag(I) efflux system membrane fusion protein